jgi:hypothetical protein
VKLKNNRTDRLLECHAHLCRADFEVTYSAGATRLNREEVLRFCEHHDRQFIKELDAEEGAKEPTT